MFISVSAVFRDSSPFPTHTHWYKILGRWMSNNNLGSARSKSIASSRRINCSESDGDELEISHSKSRWRPGSNGGLPTKHTAAALYFISFTAKTTGWTKHLFFFLWSQNLVQPFSCVYIKIYTEHHLVFMLKRVLFLLTTHLKKTHELTEMHSKASFFFPPSELFWCPKKYNPLSTSGLLMHPTMENMTPTVFQNTPLFLYFCNCLTKSTRFR